MKTLLQKREMVFQNPDTGRYDMHQVVVDYEVTEWGVEVHDYDFHTSYFDSYESKKAAEKAADERSRWANYMGDNKYFHVTTRRRTIRRWFDINMEKRNKRQKLNNPSKEYICKGVLYGWDGTPIAFLEGTEEEFVDYANNHLWGGHRMFYIDDWGNKIEYKSVLAYTIKDSIPEISDEI